MSQQTAEKFMEALEKLEANRDLEAITAVFSDNARISNVNVAPKEFEGRQGAKEFWGQYRDTFGNVKSTFQNVILTENRAALEWTTQGTTKGGEPILYSGVSILEIEGGRVVRFHAYFDTAALSQQVVKEAKA